MPRKHTRISRAQRPLRQRQHHTEQRDHSCYGKELKLDLSVFQPNSKHCGCKLIFTKAQCWREAKHLADNRFELLSHHGKQEIASYAPSRKKAVTHAIAPPPPTYRPCSRQMALEFQKTKEGNAASSQAGHLHTRIESPTRAAPTVALTTPPFKDAETFDPPASWPSKPPAVSSQNRHSFAPDFLGKCRSSGMYQRRHSRFFGPHSTFTFGEQALSQGINDSSAQPEGKVCEKPLIGGQGDFEEVVLETEGEDEWTVVFPITLHPSYV